MANRIGATGEDVRRIFPAFTGLLALLLLFPLLAGSTERYWPTHSWRTSSPETQGFDSEALASALRTIQERNIPIHSLLIERNGYVILDTYFFPFREREKHDLASATKSITSTLIGIAIGDGRLAGVEQPVFSVFSDRSVSYRDARKERMTISDLLTMRSGLDCRFDHGEPTLDQMRASAHWVLFYAIIRSACEMSELAVRRLQRCLTSSGGFPSSFGTCAGSSVIV